MVLQPTYKESDNARAWEANENEYLIQNWNRADYLLKSWPTSVNAKYAIILSPKTAN